ncbi:hypothetical protein P280DRAFT_485483 [Massarina eburnea CBS 473.64]|uniref:Uncharacterized protein n=1 Tax=Massarina eburnea CBS 473.64 TaxID=1395130 RepID=A0A6A6RG27_9PLEO|nr:hypothetical protein P280DRAFT_485483 [Massarina eburnea CBS 473.64]
MAPNVAHEPENARVYAASRACGLSRRPRRKLLRCRPLFDATSKADRRPYCLIPILASVLGAYVKPTTMIGIHSLAYAMHGEDGARGRNVESQWLPVPERCGVVAVVIERVW